MPKKPELAVIQDYPWIKTHSAPGEGCEQMPDGTYSGYGFHSEIPEEDDARRIDAVSEWSADLKVWLISVPSTPPLERLRRVLH
jgi:hypothetical protein